MKRPPKTSDHLEICLVIMPYIGVVTPSLAVGLLQSALERDGLKAKSIYANLRFLDEIGGECYSLIAFPECFYPIGDWTFAHIAFPDFHPDERAFLEAVRLHYPPAAHPGSEKQFRARMFGIRKSAARWVDRLAAEIIGTGARIVGCSSTFQHHHVPSLALLRRIRELAPEVVTMLGGANCEAFLGLTTHRCFPWVDFVVSGEADELIAPLARLILKRGREVPADELPEGVFAPVHRKRGYPCNPNGSADGVPRAIAKDLNAIPLPNYDDYFTALRGLPALRKRMIPALVYESARGCWWGRCTFCGLNGTSRKHRTKSPEKILHDLRTLTQRYGVNQVEMTDNILCMDYFESLLPKLAEAGAPYSLFYETKSGLTQRHFQLLRQAGVRWIQPGIESLHSGPLRLMRKGLKAYHNIQTLKWARQYGLRLQWVLLCDFPGEKDMWYKEMAGLLPLLYHLYPPFGSITIRYQRFSHYHERQKEYGLNFCFPELMRSVYPLPPEDLLGLTYEFDEAHRKNLRENPLLATLLARPGLGALEPAVAAWISVFWSKDQPMLGMTVTGGELVIRDTRPVAVAPSFRLSGLERDLYLACEHAQPPNALCKTFAAGRTTQEDVDSALQSLVDRKLMVRVDGRALALAVREPCEPLLAPHEFPGGCLKKVR